MSALDTPGLAGEPAWVGEVLSFWFTELTLEQCFQKNDEVDRAIAGRFAGIYEQLAADDDAIDTSAPRELLAAIVVFDQFPRNIFRGTARAFAMDPAARRLARAAVESGIDRSFDKRERIFLYLPFEHSESVADQVLSVALLGELGDPELDKYALAHKVIIDRFSRFPHRNVALGRTSTPEEIEFLKGPMSSF